MQIIAHRGFWFKESEKNNTKSFNRATRNNFGIETDIRDYCGELVISHDIPTSDSLLLVDFIENYSRNLLDKKNPPYLALNIKSDGLYEKLRRILNENNLINYFVFDMSIPDTFSYLHVKYLKP